MNYDQSLLSLWYLMAGKNLLCGLWCIQHAVAKLSCFIYFEKKIIRGKATKNKDAIHAFKLQIKLFCLM